MISIRVPEPRDSITASAIPRPVASAKEVDTEERSFFSRVSSMASIW